MSSFKFKAVIFLKTLIIYKLTLENVHLIVKANKK